MATLREIRRRISSIKSTQKITKAMKMVAAAKLRRAQEMIFSTRPYAYKMNDLMRHLVRKIDPSLHPLLQPRELQRVLIVVITSDRGLCGTFNVNVAKATVDHIQQNYSELKNVPDGIQMYIVGKKGYEFFHKRGYNIVNSRLGIFSGLQFGTARSIVDEIVKGYLDGAYDRVDVIYNEFKNVIQQRVVIEQLLPIPPEVFQPDPRNLRTLAQVDYIIEPSAVEIMNAILPKHLHFQMWRMLLESNASEQGAKMTAMDNATENARELLDILTLSYNKARQAGITKELLEIVGGAEALKSTG